MTTPNGYEMKTTFWSDFSIADVFGLPAVKDTFKRAFDEWKDDIVYITELAIVTNWKSWQHSNKDIEMSEFYAEAYYKCKYYVYDDNSKFSQEDMHYYFTMTD